MGDRFELEGNRVRALASVWFLPILMTILVAGGFTWLAWEVRARETAALAGETGILAEQAQRRLREWVDARLAVAAHFSRRWNEHYQDRPEAFRQDAELFLDRLPGMQALNWVDAGWVIRTTVPNEGNERALGADLHTHPNPDVRTAFERATATGGPSRTPANVAFFQGGRGFAFYWPVYAESGESEGFVNGVVRIDEIISDGFLGESSMDRFRLALYDGEERVAVIGQGAAEASEAADWPYALTREVDVLDGTWRLVIAPSHAALSPMGGAGAAALGSAYFVAGLVGWLLHVSLAGQRRLRLRQLELHQLATAMEQASEGIVVTDPLGRVAYANRAFGEMMGRDRAREAGASVLGLAAANGSDDVLLSEIASSLREGKPWQGRYETVWDDGSRHMRAGSVTPVRDTAGKIVRLVCVLRDVTREEELEDQLRQGQKMEAVGRLAGGAAHDFNNLLTVISACCQQMLEHPEDAEETRRSAGMIHDASERAASLIRQLLAFSRQQSLRPERLDVDEVLETLAPMLRRLIGEDVALEVEPGPGVPEIEVDRGQLEQVVVNLCLNARDAMPEGGRIVLATHRETVGEGPIDVRPELASGVYARLEVRDDGAGMPLAVRERMFDPFFTTKDVGQGTGLGLSTVYGIVEQSGGGLRVRSSPGGGTEVAVLLPGAAGAAAEASRAEPAASPRAASRPARGETILLVEDEPAILNLVTRLLESAGYRVIAASDGEEALARVNESGEEPELLLSDVIMPKLGGPDLAKRLRERLPGLRTIFMSGYALDHRTGAVRLDPGDRVIQKPFTPRALVETVERVLLGQEMAKDEETRLS